MGKADFRTGPQLAYLKVILLRFRVNGYFTDKKNEYSRSLVNDVRIYGLV